MIKFSTILFKFHFSVTCHSRSVKRNLQKYSHILHVMALCYWASCSLTSTSPDCQSVRAEWKKKYQHTWCKWNPAITLLVSCYDINMLAARNAYHHIQQPSIKLDWGSDMVKPETHLNHTRWYLYPWANIFLSYMTPKTTWSVESTSSKRP